MVSTSLNTYLCSLGSVGAPLRIISSIVILFLFILSYFSIRDLSTDPGYLYYFLTVFDVIVFTLGKKNFGLFLIAGN